jgi:signal transduction histidine kinase
MRLTIGLKYILAVTIVMLIFMGITLGVISYRHKELVIEQTKIQAKALFQQIVITRRWVADHGGVFVEKLPWVEPNPFLKDPLMTDREGRRFVRENPAMVTKQLSKYAQKDKLYSFHITSLKLMNPENAPDAFEKAALLEFDEKKTGEASTIEKIDNADFFRYIAPLYVEQACLECHHDQGYRIGDVRGAISITVPMEYALSTIASDRKYMAISAILTVAALISVLFMVTRSMVILPINMIRDHMQRFSKTGKADMPVLRTDDEIEDLSRSFTEMARTLDDYHSCLQKKIESATTELRAKNAELQEMNRSKSDFIAKISHELRTPLTSIKGAMDYLSMQLEVKGGRDDAAVFFEVIKKNAERLIRLVNNVLDYERIGLGEFGLRISGTDLRDTFEEVITGFRTEAQSRKVNILLHADDVTAYADEDRIKQVLINLISNALNFSPESSEIKVTLKDEGEYALAEVEDSGCGIDEADMDKIFRQFYSKGAKNGTGLGLAISRSIIEAHKGQIGVRDRSGGGSCFYFRIPKEQEGTDGNEKEPACNR